MGTIFIYRTIYVTSENISNHLTLVFSDYFLQAKNAAGWSFNKQSSTDTTETSVQRNCMSHTVTQFTNVPHPLKY